jgi:hypothetical protein
LLSSSSNTAASNKPISILINVFNKNTLVFAICYLSFQLSLLYLLAILPVNISWIVFKKEIASPSTGWPSQTLYLSYICFSSSVNSLSDFNTGLLVFSSYPITYNYSFTN